MDTLSTYAWRLRTRCCAMPWYVRFIVTLGVLLIGGDIAARLIPGTGIAEVIARFAVIIVPWLAVFWLFSRPETLR